MVKRTNLLGLLLAVLLVIAGACAPAAMPEAPLAQETAVSEPKATVQEEGAAVLAEEGCGYDLITATNGDSSLLSPLYGTDAPFRSDMISEPLVFLDWQSLEPIPWLAEAWHVSEDGTTYTFNLRDGPQWPDGTPLTAQDFEFTLLTMLSPDVNSDWQSLFSVLVGADEVISGEAEQLEGVRVIDDKTFELELKQPNAAFLAAAARHLKPIPRHMLEGEQLSREHPFAQDPVGVGPYRLAEYDRGDQLILEAKDDYWGDPVCARRIVDRYITDMNALALALETGDVDKINPVSPRDVVRMRDNPDLNVYQPPASQLDMVYFNVENEIMANPQVRQAIAMTINRQEFIEQVLSGVNRPARGYIVDGTWAYDPTAEAPEYDLEQAKALLEEAGYPDGFSITMVTNAGNTTREQFLSYLQSQLEEIGVTAQPEFKEWSTFITGIADGDFEIAFLESRAGVPDPDTLYADYHTDGGTNYGNYSNPEVDQLLEQARSSTDQAQRKELYYQVQQILAQDLPRVATWEYLSVFATRADIENVRPSALGSSWDAPYWRKR